MDDLELLLSSELTRMLKLTDPSGCGWRARDAEWITPGAAGAERLSARAAIPSSHEQVTACTRVRSSTGSEGRRARDRVRAGLPWAACSAKSPAFVDDRPGRARGRADHRTVVAPGSAGQCAVREYGKQRQKREPLNCRVSHRVTFRPRSI